MPYVYAFEEGSKEQKYLLGGKGANLAEMTKLGLPVPPGFTITTDACKAYMAADDTIPDGLMDEVAEALVALEAEDGQAPRRRRRPAAGVGPLRRPVLDAGDDGHRPQPRSQRRVGRRPGQADRQRALRLRLVPPLRADVRQDRARRRRRGVRAGARRAARAAGRRHRPRALGRGSRRPGRPVQGDRARGGGHRVPAGPQGAAAPRHRGGLPLLERRARPHLPAHGEDPRRPRHRGQRADDGVRQQGRRLRHRRRVHPQPGHR